ncbi:MAG: hypothetical protein JWO19_1160 [Bryobacterales bacterium]|nr:hypothetical protein [Bryobacterales bacterium]
MTTLDRSIGDRLETWAWRLDRRWGLIILILAAIYGVLIAPSLRRHLWYDELHTVYIAQATSVRQFIDEIRLLDLNPPLTYVLVRASMSVLGPTELGARLPIIVGYFLGSIGMFIFLARRVGALWAAAGVGLLWYNQSFFFASEARPYGVLLGCMGVILVSWDYATDPATAPSGRRWALAGVAIGATGMLLSHVYAPLWIMPFWAAELVRNWRQRRIDWALWAALVLPMAACLTYLPLVRNVGQAVFPPEFQGSVNKAVLFYVRTVFQVAPPLLIGGLIAFGIAAWRRRSSPDGIRPDRAAATSIPAPEMAFLLFSLLPPVLLNALAIQKHIGFYDRHAFLTTLAAYLLLILFIAYESRANRLSGLAAAIVILGFTVFLPAKILVPRPSSAEAIAVRARKDFDRIQPELPFVTNSAFTFLEMDHYEKPDLVARLYYLVDPESSIKYAHSNLTEGLLVMKQYFPIRANPVLYADFVATHRHFLVWGEMDFNGWLLRKLKTEGAHLTQIGKFDTPYLDSLLYEVRLDP